MSSGPFEHHGIGLIVPSTSQVLEAELSETLGTHRSARLSLHSSRMRLGSPAPHPMVLRSQRERAVLEIGDVRPDVVLYGGVHHLTGPAAGTHHEVEGAIAEQLALGGSEVKVRSVVGCVLEALQTLSADRVLMLDHQPRPHGLAAYLRIQGYDVQEAQLPELATSRTSPVVRRDYLARVLRDIDLDGTSVIGISLDAGAAALHVVDEVEDLVQIPTITGTTASAFGLLGALGLPPRVAGAGRLLSTSHALAASTPQEMTT